MVAKKETKGAENGSTTVLQNYETCQCHTNTIFI